jgi:cytochrome b pre-mRNA-processing protein 3
MRLLERLGLKRRAPDVSDLYAAIVAQSRRADFYEALGMPDTPNGRFEMIALHAYFVMRRLKEIGEEGTDLSQALFDHFFTDMDRNLREMGVGDLSVGKKIKSMAISVYGRIKAYDEGLAGDESELAAALKRNLYADVSPEDAHVSRMEAYVRANIEVSAGWDLSAIQAGTIKFAVLDTKLGREHAR